MKAKFINENISDVLKPKSKIELDLALKEVKNQIQEYYNIISKSNKYIITNNLGYHTNGESFYGFQFETTEPLIDGENFHKGEIGEFTLGFFDDDNVISIVFENSGYDMTINYKEDLIQFLGLHVDESIANILKPKSKEELRNQFIQDYPEFVQIYNDIFPNSPNEYNIDPGTEGLDGSFGITVKDNEGKTYVFLVKQSYFLKAPQISFLDTSKADNTFGGVFVNNKRVFTAEQVKEYINQTIN